MIQWHDSLSSTMDLAHELADAGAAHGDAVAAKEQLAGRGQRGRSWHAPRGGLWLSVVCRPPTEIGAECISLRAGLALAREIERTSPRTRIKIKWPNDLLLRNRKLAGILCEARWSGGHLDWIVIGVGLNVSNPLPKDVPGGAIRLAEVMATVPSLNSLAISVVKGIAEAGRITGPLTAEELGSFDSRDALRGRTVVEPVRGRAEGVSEVGALMVVDGAGHAHPVAGADGLVLG